MEYIQVGSNNYNADIKAEYFKNRGIENPENLMNLDSNVIRNPFDFTNIREGIQLIKKCENNNKDILIIPDSDCDGWTSSAFLYKFLLEVFFGDIKYIQHKTKSHGICMEEIEASLENIGLVIVPDAGTSDYKQHKILKNMGIDVLIIDHHDCDTGRSEDAVVINNQLDKISTNMCGASMVYYFCKAFESELDIDICEDMLDIVAVGLIGDSMDSSDPEVQYLIQKGLDNINNEFLLQLLDSTSFSRKGKENQRAFSFYIVPLFNAVVRCGSIEDNKLLFEALAGIQDDRTYKYTYKRGDKKNTTIEENLYQHAFRVANSIKGKQTRIVNKVMHGSKRPLKSGLVELIESKFQKDKILLIDATEYIDNPSLTGLVAGKINSFTKRPSFVFLKNENNDYNGSCRNNQLLNFRKEIKDNKLLSKAEGHNAAFGSSIYSKDMTISQAQTKMNDYYKDKDLRPVHRVDFNINVDEFDEYIVSDLASLEKYFGNGMDEPLIMLENLIVESNEIKQLPSGNSFYFYFNDVKFVCFDKGGIIFDKVVDWGDKMCYTLVGHPSVYNEKGSRICQMLIEDIELVKTIDNDKNDEFDDIFAKGDEDFNENEFEGEEWEW